MGRSLLILPTCDDIVMCFGSACVSILEGILPFTFSQFRAAEELISVA